MANDFLGLIDGTWQDDQPGKGDDTVAVQFAEIVNGSVDYSPGVGSRFGILGHVLGGAFGFGGNHRVKKTIKAWKIAGSPARVILVGYSRGAVLIVKVAKKLKKLGVTVQWMGLIDAVGSFGIPGNKLDIGMPDLIPSNVERCYHVMFIHERRWGFRNYRFNAGSTSPRVRECWHWGNHSCANQHQSHGPEGQQVLRSMLLDARRHGVALDLSRVPKEENLTLRLPPWQGSKRKRFILPGDAFAPSAVPPHDSVPPFLVERRNVG